MQKLSTRHKTQVITLWDHNRTDWLLGTTLKAPTHPKTYKIDNIPVELITLTRAERWRVLPYVLGYYALKPMAINKIATILATKIEPFAQNSVLIHNTRIGREPISFASLRVARKLDVPFVFVPYHHPRWVGWNYQEYLNLYQKADALVALTQTEKQILMALGVNENRIFVSGNGPNISNKAKAKNFRQQLQIPPDVPLVLFLGQKYQYKGFHHLAEAAKIVWQNHPDTYFVFIGPRTSFSRKFFKTQTDSRIIELGMVDLQQKTDALAACTLFCLPSTQESFGGVFTEAWSFAKPVIGVNIPAVSEVIDDEVNGYLVKPKAPDIAEKILHLLNNPSTAKNLGQAGQEKTEHQFNWDKLAQKTEEIYTKVLQGIGA